MKINDNLYANNVNYQDNPGEIVHIPYGAEHIALDISHYIGKIDIYYPPTSDEEPINDTDVHAFLEEQELKIPEQGTISIAINDNTRPNRYDLLLNGLLHHLEKHNCHSDRIDIWIASGTHTPIEKSSYEDFIPPAIVEKYRIHSHDCDESSNLVYLGRTSRDTPVWVNKDFFSSDLKITIGTIEPHHFMGFSGGSKTAAIGMAGRETIVKNHHLLLQPHTETAQYIANPMRMDVEEIGDMLDIDICFNAIMDQYKNVLRLLWGKPRQVMLEGIDWSKKVCQVMVPDKYDLVITSAGGFPKDINFYQAQKAITNACMICKDGAEIILAAECREGAGNQRFLQFMQGKHTFSEVIDEFSHIPFEIGPHKAYLLARQGLKYGISLKSSMDEGVVQAMLMTPLTSLQCALDNIEVSSGRKIAVLPYGGLTVPNLG